MSKESGHPPDGTGLFFAIVQRDVALGRGIELENVRDVETAFKCVPHFELESVAAAQSDFMIGFARMRRAVDQIPAKLADILKNGAFPFGDVIPEPGRGEALPHQDRTARNQYRADRHYSANAVIHRQTIVHPVARARAHQSREPIAPLQYAEMADLGGLR